MAVRKNAIYIATNIESFAQTEQNFSRLGTALLAVHCTPDYPLHRPTRAGARKRGGVDLSQRSVRGLGYQPHARGQWHRPIGDPSPACPGGPDPRGRHGG